MPDATTTLFLVPADPPPIARTMPFQGTGRLMLVMPGGITLHGEPDLIQAWLQCGLDALSDGSVHWGATEAVIVPEHPSVNHVGLIVNGEPIDQAVCGAEGGNVDAGEITCPLCLRMTEEAGPDAA